MIDPLVLTLCPDGHLDGPRRRVIVPRNWIRQVYELPADPGSPHLARCEVVVAEADVMVGAKTFAVAEPFDAVAALIGAAMVEVAP